VYSIVGAVSFGRVNHFAAGTGLPITTPVAMAYSKIPDSNHFMSRALTLIGPMSQQRGYVLRLQLR
jgi:hypothetical protein